VDILILVKLMMREGANDWTQGYFSAIVGGHPEIAKLFEETNDPRVHLPDLAKNNALVVEDDPKINFSQCLEKTCEAGRLDIIENLIG